MPKAAYAGPWRKLRLYVLRRDGYLCRVALPGCTVHATEVDHEYAVAIYGPNFDPAHLRACCHGCNMKLMGEMKRLKNALARATVSVGPSREW